MRDCLLLHWQGRLGLTWSFWVNLCLLRCVLFAVQEPLLEHLPAEALMADALVTLWVVFVHGLVLAWQLVGVVRSLDRECTGAAWLARRLGAQMILLLFIVLSASYGISAFQQRPSYRTVDVSAPGGQPSSYKLELDRQGTDLRISGAFDHGLTRAVSRVFTDYPSIRRVTLDSPGGNVFEGRGLSRLFMRLDKTTHVEALCASACTTAYIGGRERTAGRHARLGFHQYRFTRVHAFMPTTAQAQQQRDEELFRDADVDNQFIRRMFSRPPDDMWWPTMAVMQSAGVIHRIQ